MRDEGPSTKLVNMATNAQEAMAALDRANAMADQGDFMTAYEYWTDACRSLVAAKTAGEHLVGQEYAEAGVQASRLLDRCGQQMAEAIAESNEAGRC